MKVGRVDDLKKEPSVRRSTGEILGFLSDLSAYTGLKNVAIHHELLPVGHRSSPPHSHTEKEEFVYVLEGNPTVWINGEEQILSAGDFVGLAPVPSLHHMIKNDGGSEAKLLVISVSGDNDETAFCQE